MKKDATGILQDAGVNSDWLHAYFDQFPEQLTPELTDAVDAASELNMITRALRSEVPFGDIKTPVVGPLPGDSKPIEQPKDPPSTKYKWILITVGASAFAGGIMAALSVTKEVSLAVFWACLFALLAAQTMCMLADYATFRLYQSKIDEAIAEWHNARDQFAKTLLYSKLPQPPTTEKMQ